MSSETSGSSLPPSSAQQTSPQPSQPAIPAAASLKPDVQQVWMQYRSATQELNMSSYKNMLGYVLVDTRLAKTSPLQRDIIPSNLESLKQAIQLADHRWLQRNSLTVYVPGVTNAQQLKDITVHVTESDPLPYLTTPYHVVSGNHRVHAAREAILPSGEPDYFWPATIICDGLDNDTLRHIITVDNTPMQQSHNPSPGHYLDFFELTRKRVESILQASGNTVKGKVFLDKIREVLDLGLGIPKSDKNWMMGLMVHQHVYFNLISLLSYNVWRENLMVSHIRILSANGRAYVRTFLDYALLSFCIDLLFLVFHTLVQCSSCCAPACSALEKTEIGWQWTSC